MNTGLSCDSLREIDLMKLFKKDSQGYLVACAAIHNKEQHRENGNIEFTVVGDAGRDRVADAAYRANVCFHCLMGASDAQVPLEEGAYAGLSCDSLREIDLMKLLKKCGDKPLHKI